MTDQKQADLRLALFQEGLAKIKQRFLKELPETVVMFDDLMDCLYLEKDHERTVEDVKFQAHKLNGRAGSFGLEKVSQRAARVELEAEKAIEGPRPIVTEEVEVCLVLLLDEIENYLLSQEAA